MDDAKVTRHRVLVVTHLFPTAENPLQGPWVAEQVDACQPLADMSVLCCSQLTGDRVELRPSGVEVTFARTATPLGRGRVGLLASSLRYRSALGAYLKRRKSDFDLVHAHFGFPDAVVTRRVCRRMGLPYVVTLHGDDAFKLLPRRDVLGRLVRAAVAGAASVICVSEAMRAAVTPFAPGADVRVITNGYDAQLFRPSTTPRDLGFLFVGLFVPVKNLDLLLRAYALVRDRVDARLTLVGEGPLRPSLEELARELGLEDRVRFLGVRSREEVAALMQRAKAVLLPSKSEGWPLVVTESLACGTPVVASSVGGIPEIITSEAGGVLVAPNDVSALAEALVRAAGRDWDAAAVASSSAARPWTEQAKSIVGVYDDVLGGPRREA